MRRLASLVVGLFVILPSVAAGQEAEQATDSENAVQQSRRSYRSHGQREHRPVRRSGREFSFGTSGGYGYSWLRTSVTGNVSLGSMSLSLEEFNEEYAGATIDTQNIAASTADYRYPTLELHTANSRHGRLEFVIPLINMITDFADGIYGFSLDILGSFAWGSPRVKFVFSSGVSLGIAWQNEIVDDMDTDYFGVLFAGVMRLGPEIDLGTVRFRIMARNTLGYVFTKVVMDGEIGPVYEPAHMRIDLSGHSFVYGLMGELSLLFDM